MKYLFDLFVPCSSFSETNMLLAKTSFFYFFIVENYVLSTQSYTR